MWNNVPPLDKHLRQLDHILLVVVPCFAHKGLIYLRHAQWRHVGWHGGPLHYICTICFEKSLSQMSCMGLCIVMLSCSLGTGLRIRGKTIGLKSSLYRTALAFPLRVTQQFFFFFFFLLNCVKLSHTCTIPPSHLFLSKHNCLGIVSLCLWLADMRTVNAGRTRYWLFCDFGFRGWLCVSSHTSVK